MSDSKEKKIVHIHLGPTNYKTIMTAGRHEITADEPERKGGEDEGPDAYDLLMMSLGSCTVITMRMYAERKEWPVEDIYIELQHHKKKDEDGNVQDVIEKEILVEGDLDDDQLQRLLEISKRCPIHLTLEKEPVMESVIKRKGNS